jgi:ATP-dependent Clp protease ATP-binding subunit ClpA
MFERFTNPAREVVAQSQENARRLKHGYIGTEHLLLALAEQDSGAGALLHAEGLTAKGIEEAIVRFVGTRPGTLGADDAAALRAIGIDLDEVIARIEKNFGPVPLEAPQPEARRWFPLRRQRPAGRGRTRLGGHVPFTGRAKKVLELSLREAIALSHNHIGSEHILLGLLREGNGLAAQAIRDAGVDLTELRQRTIASLEQAA